MSVHFLVGLALTRPQFLHPCHMWHTFMILGDPARSDAFIIYENVDDAMTEEKREAERT